MTELTKDEKLEMLNQLEKMKYDGRPLCEFIRYAMINTYNNRVLFASGLFPEALKVIRDEGNKLGESWVYYNHLLEDPVKCRAFREKVLKKIINLKHEL